MLSATGGVPSSRLSLNMEVPIEQRKAFRALVAVANQGDAAALCAVGDALASGEVVKPNGRVAVRCYLAAMQKGYTLAKVHFGQMLDEGAAGVDRDCDAARYTYAEALTSGDEKIRQKLEEIAETGSDAALTVLARDDVHRGNYESAFKRASEAVRIHQKSPTSHFYLAEFYECGTGVEKDEKKAALHYYKSALFGSKEGGLALSRLAEEGGIEANYHLGLLMQRLDVPEKGFPLFRRAALAAHPEACFELGKCYLHGLGVEPNEETAAFWFAKGPVEEVSTEQD